MTFAYPSTIALRSWCAALALTSAGLVLGERDARGADPASPAVIAPPASPPSVSAAPPGSPTEPVAPQAAPAGTVVVDVVGGTSAVLQLRNPASGEFAPLCHAPCRREVPADGVFRIVGRGIPSTGGFGLNTTDGRPVVLRVTEGSTAGFALGVVIVTLSAVAGFVGYGLVLPRCGFPVGSCSAPPTLATGGAVLGSALAVSLAGFYLMVTNRATSVEQVTQPPPRPTKALFPRAPEPGERAVTDASVGVYAPLFSGRF